MVPRAVLLDFDGVVVDSLRLHLDAWTAATLEVFKSPLTEPERLAGHGTRAIAGLISKRMGDGSLAPTLARRKESWLAENVSRLELLPGSRAFIDALKARGIPHGIASNSHGAFVRGALKATGLIVDNVITGDEVARGKPRPDIYWQLANQLRIDPKQRGEILVFEDSEQGLKAAIAAGMIPIGVASDQSEAVLRSYGAVEVCSNLGEALAKDWLSTRPL